MRRALALAAVLASLGLGASGCFDHAGTGVAAPQVTEVPFPNSDDGVTPQLGLSARSRPHVPLSIGDRWDYVVHVRIRTDDGSGPASTLAFERQGFRDIIGTSSTGSGRLGVLQSFGLGPFRTPSNEIAQLRVAEAGVFYLDPRYIGSSSPPPPDPPGAGAEPGESTALRFPFTRGAHWRTGYPFSGFATVVGVDRVRVPAGDFIAWRVELGASSGDPGDRHTYWYSDAGLIRESHREVDELFDSQGFHRGQEVFEVVVELKALQLAPEDMP